MTTLFLGLEAGLMRIDVNGNGKAQAEWANKVPVAFSVSIDPIDPKNVVATHVGAGVFRSEDGGRTFEPGGQGVFSPLVWSSIISPTERTKDGGVVYVGTMPSMMFRSEDGGRTFRHMEEFAKLETLKEAAFPPVPASHMIHMIASSFHDEGTVLAGIELGGVVKSTDGGENWKLTDGGPDCHQLLFHPDAEGRVYESDGNGPFQSRDSGETWETKFDGFPDDVTYFYDMAVDPGDPGLQMISAGRNQYQAHGIDPYFYEKGVYQGAFGRTSGLSGTFSSLYRRRDGEAWEEMLNGLPDPNGTAQGRFATALGDDKGTIYYTTVPGDVYRTTDGGDSWEPIEIKWPADAAERTVHVARAVKE